MDSPAVTLIRESYEAMNEGEFERWADRVPANFELVPPANSGMGKVIGPEGISRWYAELTEALETVRTELEEIVDFGQRVVVLGRIRNRGRGSGIEVDVVAAHLWTVENGVPVRIELIGDREEALRRGAAESSG